MQNTVPMHVHFTSLPVLQLGVSLFNIRLLTFSTLNNIRFLRYSFIYNKLVGSITNTQQNATNLVESEIDRSVVIECGSRSCVTYNVILNAAKELFQFGTITKHTWHEDQWRC